MGKKLRAEIEARIAAEKALKEKGKELENLRADVDFVTQELDEKVREVTRLEGRAWDNNSGWEAGSSNEGAVKGARDAACEDERIPAECNCE